jgi:hypothetical protein
LPTQNAQVVTLIRVEFDPVDFAPRPLRVVHARVVREKLL